MKTEQQGLLGLEPDEVETAEALLKGALALSAMTKGQMTAALESGFGLALHGGPRTTWPTATPDDREKAAAGRLLLRLAHALDIPLETQLGASAKALARLLLA